MSNRIVVMKTRNHANSDVVAWIEDGAHHWECKGTGCPGKSDRPLSEDEARTQINAHADACAR